MRDHDTTPRKASRDSSGSFLLRIWSEPRETSNEPPRVRVFLRNLKTGEEHYLGDLDQLGEEVLRQFKHTDSSAVGEENSNPGGGLQPVV